MLGPKQALATLGLVCAVMSAACRGEPRPGAAATRPAAPQPTVARPTAAETPAEPADSLALRTSGGTEVWLSAAREARDSNGQSCLERTLVIVAGSRRLPVPLLYTRDLPRLVNDSTFAAHISNHCAPGDRYLVNLRTGQPVRVPR